jgi:uncharacterized protein
MLTPAPASAPAGERFVSLDVIRGVAVMGILAMNIVMFALPSAAYVNPLAIGMDSPLDTAAWAFGFVFVEGKMRGLFSLLFGASMLLVIERAEASGRRPAATHVARMAWLFVFGALHYYLVWEGDILLQYALIGLIAYAYRHLAPSALLLWAAGLFLVQFLLLALPNLSLLSVAEQLRDPEAFPRVAAKWEAMLPGFGVVPGEIEHNLLRYRGDYLSLVAYRIFEEGSWPLEATRIYGPETLALFLLGMWGLRSGLLTGEWDRRAYRRLAAIGLGISVPVYAAFAWWVWVSGFRIEVVQVASLAGTILFRPLMILGFAALIILLVRKGGPLHDRIAAAGRAAFTNYLGTSLLLTTLFYGYGFGLYGHLSRAELWPIVFAVWGLMLLWSKPWLERYRYGPLEWLWRSLARWQVQPLRLAKG